MNKIATHWKILLLVFVSSWVFWYSALGLSGPQNSQQHLDGYFRLIENASLPILLADQKDRFTLQISALIEDTPVRQVRIYDNQGNLQFRIQNTTNPETGADFVSLSDALLFENVAAGTLEVDLDAAINRDLVHSVMLPTVASLAMTLLFAALTYQLVRSNENRTNSTVSNSGPGAGRSFEIGSGKRSETEIFLVIRVNPTTDTPPDDADYLSAISSMRVSIDLIAELYDAEPISVSASTLVFSLGGKINRQNVHKATLLCWGIAWSEDEQGLSGKNLTELQTYILGSNELLTETRNSLAFWTELNAKCQPITPFGAYISKAISEFADLNTFELTPALGSFYWISDANNSIKTLWRNQTRSQVSAKLNQ